MNSYKLQCLLMLLLFRHFSDIPAVDFMPQMVLCIMQRQRLLLEGEEQAARAYRNRHLRSNADAQISFYGLLHFVLQQERNNRRWWCFPKSHPYKQGEYSAIDAILRQKPGLVE